MLACDGRTDGQTDRQTCTPPIAKSRSSIAEYDRNLQENGKVILVDPHQESNQHQNVITCRPRESPLVHAYQVWSSSIYAFVSYVADRRTDIQTNRHTQTQYMFCLLLGARRCIQLKLSVYRLTGNIQRVTVSTNRD